MVPPGWSGPPDEESPLDVLSWLKWGSKDTEWVWGSQKCREREQAVQGEGLCVKPPEAETCLLGVLNTREAP